MKANDFFISIYDLFSKILPGLVLILGIDFFYPALLASSKTQNTTLFELILFITSYITGHVISPIGALFDQPADLIMDKFKIPAKEHYYDDRLMAEKKAREVFQVPENKKIRRRLLEAMLKKKNNASVIETETFLTIAKFFRSLVIVFFIFLIFPYFPLSETAQLNERQNIHILYCIVVSVLLLASFLIFIYYRSRFKDAVYRHFLCLFYEPKTQ